jgi:DNA primase
MDAVEDIKSRLSIEDVVGEYVQLKRSGRNFKGLSPFSGEKTPSLMVSPEKQIWHDFSSGKGGDMFSFVMEVEGLDFRDTMDLLARKAGVDLSQYQGRRGDSNAKQKERLYEALEQAAKFYQVQFSKTKDAYEYVLGKRQFSKDTALEWQLGYSPTDGKALMDYLLSRKFSLDELKGAGLVTQRYKGAGDMFRGRIMIPLHDPQGRVVGFTARLLKDDKNAPKYINTPQTILYDKSRHVYGLHLAKDAIRKSGFVVLVEGNLDVIASHQAGVRQVVATAGTALTEPNLKTLSRFTDDVRLSFDADKAGVAATERAIPIASKVGIGLSMITIPSGKDPDELIKQSKDTWLQVIDQPQYALDWLMERYRGLLDVSSARGKKQFSDILLPIIRKLQDSVEQDHYMVEVAQILGVSRDALDKKLVRQPGREEMLIKKPAVGLAALDRASVEYRRIQDHVMALLLFHPSLRLHAVLLTEEMFTAGQAKYIFRYLRKYPDYQGDGSDIIEGLNAKQVQSLQDYAKILLLQHEELYGDVEDIELGYEMTRLQARLIEQYIKHEKQNLTQQLGRADEEMTRQILVRVKELDTLLNKAQRSQGGQRG